MRIAFLIFILQLFFCQYICAQGPRGAGNQSVTNLPLKEKRWALIVGIDDYERDVSTLKGAVNDAKALRETLIRYAGFPENQVILLTSNSVDLDDRPKRENILGALSELSMKVPEGGLLLFSFSGHGVSVGNQAFLIPSNGRITKNLSLLKSLSINVSDIREAIQEIKVKQVLMLLDACRNEPGKGETPNVLTEAYKPGFSFDVVNSEVKAFATLYATSVSERAFEFYDKNSGQYRGYFSYAVEEALKGKAETANEKGEVTLGRLIKHIETSVPGRVKFEKGEVQVPSATVSETYKADELILSAIPVPERVGIKTSAPKNGDQLFWDEMEKRKTVSAYETYISQFPNGDFLKIAKVRLAALKWEAFKPLAKGILKYDSVDSFSENFASVTLDNKSGFIDRKGALAVPLKYDNAFRFLEGLARVCLRKNDGYKCGFIDKTGTEVISLKYDDVGSFSDGLAWATLGDKGSLIDKTGKEVIPLKYDGADWRFREGLIWVVSNKKYGFVNKVGTEIIPPKYDSAFPFFEGRAAVSLKGRYGFIDITGKEIIPIKYDVVGMFSEGMAWTKLGTKSGFIDRSGNDLFSVKYDFVWSFLDGLGMARIGESGGGKFGFIDTKGKEVVPVKYNDIWCRGFKKEGFIGITLDGKKGFVDFYGNEYFDF